MTPKERQKARATLWIVMVEHAELLNDAVVLYQVRASARVARKIAIAAAELNALAHAAALLSPTGGKRNEHR